MSVQFDGIDDLMSTIENLGNIGTRAGKKAIQSGCKIVLEQMKKDAPKDDGDSILPSQNAAHGADFLDLQEIKLRPNYVYGAVGIGSKNWEQTKQFWFQHYGFEDMGLNFRGKPFIKKHTGWVYKSREKCGDKAEDEVIKVLLQEINKIW